MKLSVKRLATGAVVLGGALFLGRNIVVSAASESPATSRPSDARRAEREVQPAQGEDFRRPLPEGWLVSAPGVVEPADRPVEVAADGPGRVAAVEVREGQRVEAGAVLVRLAAEVEAAAVMAAKAERESARAELARSEAGSPVQDVEATRAALASAMAQAKLSGAVAARTSKLAERRSASADEQERAEAQAEADLARVGLARAEHEGAKARLGEARSMARARLQGAEARVLEAEARLAQRSVRAPSAGEVLQVKVRPGEAYDPQRGPLVVLGDTARLRARVDVDERDLARVQVGQPVVVRVAAQPGVDRVGTVVELGRRMGRKNVRTDDPAERNDTKILEALVALESGDGLMVGQRVDAFLGKR